MFTNTKYKYNSIYYTRLKKPHYPKEKYTLYNSVWYNTQRYTLQLRL